LGNDPLDVLQPPGEADAWDEQRLAPPAETGIYAVDAEARKLHAAADFLGTVSRRYATPVAPGVIVGLLIVILVYYLATSVQNAFFDALNPAPRRG